MNAYLTESVVVIKYIKLRFEHKIVILKPHKTPWVQICFVFTADFPPSFLCFDELQLSFQIQQIDSFFFNGVSLTPTTLRGKNHKHPLI